MDSFISRTHPFYYASKIIQFANLIKIHPGIIAGQLNIVEKIDWTANRQMLVYGADILISRRNDGWMGNSRKIKLWLKQIKLWLKQNRIFTGNRGRLPRCRRAMASYGKGNWRLGNSRGLLEKRQLKNQTDQCAEEIAAAMRVEFFTFTDPQGREVRKKHPYRELVELPDGKQIQQYLWIDMEDPNLKHEEAELALLYGKMLILGDCKY